MSTTSRYTGWDGARANVATVGTYSAENNSTSLLEAGATFTGAFEQNDYPDVAVSCQASHDGVLYFDFSVDGVNYSTFPTGGFVVQAGIHEFHTAVKLPRWFRVRFVNGATTQDYFRLYTYYGTYRHGNAPLNQTLGTDADAIVVRAIPSEVDAALGKLGGVDVRDKFGHVYGIGTSIQIDSETSWVDLWADGGLRTSPTAPFTPHMASDDTGDDLIEVTATYQDTGGTEREVTVSTDTGDATSPISLGVTATELYRAYISGSVQPDGNISIATTDTGWDSGVPSTQSKKLMKIPYPDNQSLALAFRIPKDKQGVLTHINLYLSRISGGAGAADLVLQTRLQGKLWRTLRYYELTTAVSVHEEFRGASLPAFTDVRVRIRDVSDASSVIAGNVQYMLIDA
jgi:hypothetical protein